MFIYFCLSTILSKVFLSNFPIDSKWKVSGDYRFNKTPGLRVLSLIFMREHNRLCDKFKRENPSWSAIRLFQEARKWVHTMASCPPDPFRTLPSIRASPSVSIWLQVPELLCLLMKVTRRMSILVSITSSVRYERRNLSLMNISGSCLPLWALWSPSVRSSLRQQVERLSLCIR